MSTVRAVAGPHVFVTRADCLQSNSGHGDGSAVGVRR
jgi:hypothetical protein